jgi:hypothetical protein
MASELLHTAPLVQKLVARFVAASMPQHVETPRFGLCAMHDELDNGGHGAAIRVHVPVRYGCERRVDIRSGRMASSRLGSAVSSRITRSM